MPFDDDPEDERPASDRLLPPEDRLWRHPSELAGTVGAPHALGPAPASSRRTPALTVLAGACLAGAVVAFGAMWIARPTRVVEQEQPARAIRTAVTTQSAVFGAPVPTEDLSGRLGPSVAHVRVERDGAWTDGTAIWIDERGTLAVAGPLVAGATSILVTGDDRRSRPAELAGIDPVTGVAALVVDATGGTPFGVADGTLETGVAAAVVGANGADAGQDSADATVALVVVRSVSVRATVGDVVLHDAIQLDRAVPDDAHGGALVDGEGDLLGMVVGNSAERGVGAAIPGPSVVAAATDLRDRGGVRRAWLGVRAVDLDPNGATLLGLPGGATLTEVTPQSPAAAAGLRVGDVVTAVDGRPIDDASDLVNRLAVLEPGAEVVVQVHRDRASASLPVTLGG